MRIAKEAFLQRNADKLGKNLEYDSRGNPLNGVIVDGISDEDLRALIKTIAPQETRCKGALDAITEVYGSKL